MIKIPPPLAPIPTNDPRILMILLTKIKVSNTMNYEMPTKKLCVNFH